MSPLRSLGSQLLVGDGGVERRLEDVGHVAAVRRRRAVHVHVDRQVHLVAVVTVVVDRVSALASVAAAVGRGPANAVLEEERDGLGGGTEQGVERVLVFVVVVAAVGVCDVVAMLGRVVEAVVGIATTLRERERNSLMKNTKFGLPVPSTIANRTQPSNQVDLYNPF